MTNILNDVCNIMKAQNALSLLDARLLAMLHEIDRSLSEEASIVLALYLARLKEGNTRIRLELGAKQSAELGLDEIWHQYIEKSEEPVDAFKDIESSLRIGIQELCNNKYPVIVANKDEFEETLKQLDAARDDSEVSRIECKPFVLDEENGTKYLYAAKYYEAKRTIESRFCKLFVQDSASNSSWTKQTLRDYFQAHLSDRLPSDEQLDVI